MTNKDERIEELLSELREIAFDLTPTRNDKVEARYDLSKDEMVNEVFDIDIFFSRKPGMRRSVQLIASYSEKQEYRELSCLAAIGSLLDTFVSNGITDDSSVVDFLLSYINSKLPGNVIISLKGKNKDGNNEENRD